MDGGHGALEPAAAASGDARRPRGPDTALWARAVCKEGQLPPLQPGEHMTVGQVRHPELHEAFVKTFSDWWLKLKKEILKKKRGGKQWQWPDEQGISAWTVVCEHGGGSTPETMLSLADRAAIEESVLRLLGWSNIKVKHLRDLMSRAPSADEALELLLRSSRRQQREDARRQAQQQQQQPGAGSEDEDEGECVAADTWFELPADVPVDDGVVSGVISSEDPRQGLHGGRGLFAARDLPRLLTLGPYRHYCMFQSTYEALTGKPPPNWKQTPGSWGLQMESYAATDEVCRLEAISSYSLVHSGWGYGNATAYANDPHLNPLEHVCTEGMEDDYVGPYMPAPGGGEACGNALCIVVRIMGWPYMWMCTTKEVPAGREVLYDYGRSYWSFIVRALKVVQTEWAAEEKAKALLRAAQEEAAKLKLELQRMREREATQQSSGLDTSAREAPSASAAGDASAAGAAPGGGAAAPAASSLTGVGQGLQGLHLASQQDPGSKRFSRSEGEASEAEEEASSAFPCGLQQQPLLTSERQLELVEENCRRYRERQSTLTAKRPDAEGNMQTFTKTRVNDPEVVKLISDAETRLSEILFRYPMGVRLRRIRDRWFHDGLRKYEYDEWAFITSRPQYFTVSSGMLSQTTTVGLTDEWREELEHRFRREGRAPPAQQGGGFQRKVTEERIVRVRDEGAEAELRELKRSRRDAELAVNRLETELRQQRSEVERQRARAEAAEEEAWQLRERLVAAGLEPPPARVQAAALLPLPLPPPPPPTQQQQQQQQQQQRAGGERPASGIQQGGAAAAAAASMQAGDPLRLDQLDLASVPVPGMGSDDDGCSDRGADDDSGGSGLAGRAGSQDDMSSSSASEEPGGQRNWHQQHQQQQRQEQQGRQQQGRQRHGSQQQGWQHNGHYNGHEQASDSRQRQRERSRERHGRDGGEQRGGHGCDEHGHGRGGWDERGGGWQQEEQQRRRQQRPDGSGSGRHYGGDDRQQGGGNGGFGSGWGGYCRGGGGQQFSQRGGATGWRR